MNALEGLALACVTWQSVPSLRGTLGQYSNTRQMCYTCNPALSLDFELVHVLLVRSLERSVHSACELEKRQFMTYIIYDWYAYLEKSIG